MHFKVLLNTYFRTRNIIFPKWHSSFLETHADGKEYLAASIGNVRLVKIYIFKGIELLFISTVFICEICIKQAATITDTDGIIAKRLGIGKIGICTY